MKNANPGDIVKITTEDADYEGILMPRPEMLEQGITVIKLDSGYNIGIDDKKIKKSEVIEKYKAKDEKKPKVQQDKNLPNVTIISTGGTIASRVDYRTGGVKADYSADDFVQMMPELAKIANIKAKKVLGKMSEDFTPKDWIAIAKEAAKELESADGVVITMGTDTLHFVAAALSFFIRHPGKPVVITAAQRSIDRGSSDAFMNLICAVTAAAKSDIAEVASCMHATESDDYCFLIRGAKVRKMHTTKRDAFRPVNDLPLAKVYPEGKIEVIAEGFSKRSGKPAVLESSFEEKTALVYIYPGMDGSVIDYYISKGCRGIVIAATALGHVPDYIMGNVEKAAKQIPVVIASQTIYGRVHPLVYSRLRELSIKMQCIFAEDMMPETAYVKLGWALSKSKNAEDARKIMLENIAGEITERTLPETFLY